MVTNRNTTAKVPIKQSLIQRLGSMLTSIKIVFSHWPYIALAGTIATIFWIVFNVFEQLLFFSPIVVFYLPEDAITGFILSNITAILLGIVVSMNVYVLKHSRSVKLSATSIFSSSTIGKRKRENTCIIYGNYKLDSIDRNSVILTRNSSSHGKIIDIPKILAI